MKIYIIQLLFFLFFQCNSKTEVQQNIQSRENFGKGSIKFENLIIENNDNNINSCKNICLVFPKNINRITLTKKNPIEFSIINNSENVVIIGEKYKIEKFSGEKWIPIEIEGIFTDIGYKINPKSKVEINIPTYFLRNLSIGRYKIYQEVMVIPDKSKLYFVNEFLVTE